MRHMSCGVGVFLLAGLSFASAQDITLRLVDAKSGKPMSKISVSMHAWNGMLDIHKPPYPERIEIRATTDAGGIAVFHLVQPAPEHIGFLLAGPMDFYGCWGQVFASETVLRSASV
jgi:hypothetical protein